MQICQKNRIFASRIDKIKFHKHMFVTTDAIVLALRKHSDKAMLLSVYTLRGGRRELLVFGINSKRSGRGHYLPLQVLEITYDEVPNRDIQTLKEAHTTSVFTQIGTEIRKQTIALYMAEVLYRTLTHPMEDEVLFRRIVQTIAELESSEQPEQIPNRFVEGLNQTMGYDVYSEVKDKLKSLPVLTALLESTDL